MIRINLSLIDLFLDVWLRGWGICKHFIISGSSYSITLKGTAHVLYEVMTIDDVVDSSYD